MQAVYIELDPAISVSAVLVKRTAVNSPRFNSLDKLKLKWISHRVDINDAAQMSSCFLAVTVIVQLALTGGMAITHLLLQKPCTTFL